MKTRILISALAIVGSIGAAPAFAALDTDTATVRMNVGLFASLTGLEDFVLTTTDTDGAAGATYSGADKFNLESNGQVRVSMTGADLASRNGSKVATTYNLDDSGLTFDTESNKVHNSQHSVAASATLGSISAQQAGAYSSVITLTVSAI
ncbi:MAG: hypothetical protein AB8B95_11210 [Pseudohongiellaceae bacterium]